MALERLVNLGMNQTKVALLVALAAEGGSATTVQLRAAVPMQRSSLHRHLKALIADGYVRADVPLEEITPGVRVRWQLNHEALHGDLDELVRQTTPKTPNAR
jgi:DNA-binding IclR family transcriptional regulator